MAARLLFSPTRRRLISRSLDRRHVAWILEQTNGVAVAGDGASGFGN